MNIEHWWNYTGREKLNHSVKNPSKYNFVYHKSHMD